MKWSIFKVNKIEGRVSSDGELFFKVRYRLVMNLAARDAVFPNALVLAVSNRRPEVLR